MLRLELWGLRKQRERHKQRSKGVLQDARSNCNIHNTGNILKSIVPVLYQYQSIVTCMHGFNYAIVLRTLLYLRYQHRPSTKSGVHDVWYEGCD